MTQPTQQSKEENSILKNQKDTLWKIKDCDEELKTRITEAKVMSEIETLDKKMALQVRKVDMK